MTARIWSKCYNDYTALINQYIADIKKYPELSGELKSIQDCADGLAKYYCGPTNITSIGSMDLYVDNIKKRMIHITKQMIEIDKTKDPEKAIQRETALICDETNRQKDELNRLIQRKNQIIEKLKKAGMLTDSIEQKLNDLTDDLKKQYEPHDLNPPDRGLPLVDRDAFDACAGKISTEIYHFNTKIDKQFKDELRQLMARFSVEKTILMK